MGLAARDTSTVLGRETILDGPRRELRRVEAEATTQTSVVYVSNSFRFGPGTALDFDAQFHGDWSGGQWRGVRAQLTGHFESFLDAQTAGQFVNSFEVVPAGFGSSAVGRISELLESVFGDDAYIGSISLDREGDSAKPQLVVRAHYRFPPDGDVDLLLELHNEFLRRYVLEVPAESRQSIALESVPTE